MIQTLIFGHTGPARTGVLTVWRRPPPTTIVLSLLLQSIPGSGGPWSLVPPIVPAGGVLA